MVLIALTRLDCLSDLGGLDLPDGPCHETLEHGAPVVVQQMYLVDDDESHELGVGAVSRLPRDDVPLLGGRHDHLQLLYRSINCMVMVHY